MLANTDKRGVNKMPTTTDEGVWVVTMQITQPKIYSSSYRFMKVHQQFTKKSWLLRGRELKCLQMVKKGCKELTKMLIIAVLAVLLEFYWIEIKNIVCDN